MADGAIFYRVSGDIRKELVRECRKFKKEPDERLLQIWMRLKNRGVEPVAISGNELERMGEKGVRVVIEKENIADVYVEGVWQNYKEGKLEIVAVPSKTMETGRGEKKIGGVIPLYGKYFGGFGFVSVAREVLLALKTSFFLMPACIFLGNLLKYRTQGAFEYGIGRVVYGIAVFGKFIEPVFDFVTVYPISSLVAGVAGIVGGVVVLIGVSEREKQKRDEPEKFGKLVLASSVLPFEKVLKDTLVFLQYNGFKAIWILWGDILQ